jgi:hypothetical protein
MEGPREDRLDGEGYEMLQSNLACVFGLCIVKLQLLLQRVDRDFNATPVHSPSRLDPRPVQVHLCHW